MRDSIIALGVTFVTFSFAFYLTASATETDEQSIHETYKAWLEVTNEKDLEKWSTFLDTSPYFHPADSAPLMNKDEVMSYYARSFADPRFSLDCEQEYVDLSASGELAWSRGKCKATFTGPEGTESSGASRWLKVWIKRPDGSWRCRVNTWRNVN